MKRSLELAEKLIHQSYLEKEEYMELLGSYQDKETVVCLGQEAASCLLYTSPSPRD